MMMMILMLKECAFITFNTMVIKLYKVGNIVRIGIKRNCSSLRFTGTGGGGGGGGGERERERELIDDMDDGRHTKGHLGPARAGQ